jgi:inorganic pyrophosphatase
MIALELLPANDAHGHLQAVIESPQGSRNKLKHEPGTGTFRVSHCLPAGMSFPFDFGFIPGTRGPDGDPLDVLVLMDAPAFPGCLVSVRLLGVIEAEQEQDGATVRNDRLIAQARGSTERGRPRRLKDLDESLLDEIEAFFLTYNRLRGRRFAPLSRKGPKTAHELVENGRRRLGRAHPSTLPARRAGPTPT